MRTVAEELLRQSLRRRAVGLRLRGGPKLVTQLLDELWIRSLHLRGELLSHRKQRAHVAGAGRRASPGRRSLIRLRLRLGAGAGAGGSSCLRPTECLAERPLQHRQCLRVGHHRVGHLHERRVLHERVEVDATLGSRGACMCAHSATRLAKAQRRRCGNRLGIGRGTRMKRRGPKGCAAAPWRCASRRVTASWRACS